MPCTPRNLFAALLLFFVCNNLHAQLACRVRHYLPGKKKYVNRATRHSKNGLSPVFVIYYGLFTCYSRGNCGGNVSYGDAAGKI